MRRLLSTLPILTALAVGMRAAPAAAAPAIVWVPESNHVIRFYNQGADALNQGDPARAEARARRALQVQESFGEAHLLLGTALQRQGRLDEALDVLSALDQRAPGRSPVLTELAITWFAKEDFGRADAYALDAVGRQPSHDAAWQALTLVRRRTGSVEPLLQMLHEERARSDRPQLACFQAQALAAAGDPVAGAAALEECRAGGDSTYLANAQEVLGGPSEEGDGQSAPELLNAAAAAFDAGDLSRAVRLATRALDAGAPPVQALLLRAEARHRADDAAGARKDIERALGGGESWVRVQREGELVGVLTGADEDRLRERMRRAAGVLVRIRAADGESEGWRASLDTARRELGDGAALRAAEAVALQLEGQLGKAWEVVRGALEGGDDPVGLGAVAADLGYEAAALASDPVVEAVRLRATPVAVYNLASGAANANLWTRCLALTDGLLRDGGTVARSPRFAAELATVQSPVAALGYGCAVGAEDLDGALARGRAAQWGPPLAPEDLWAHAVALARDQRFADVVEVLDASGAPRVAPAGAAAATDLLIAAHLRLGARDAALALVRSGPATAVARLEVGAALLEAGRTADAADLLDGTCPELVGAERARCEGELRRARAR